MKGIDAPGGPDGVQFWLYELTRFEKEREKWRRSWDRVRDDYELGMRSGRAASQTPMLAYVMPSRVYSTVHTMESMIFGRDPKFFYEESSPEYLKLARLMERVRNAKWRMNARLRREMRLCCRDMLTTSWGVALTRYASNYDEERRRREKRLRKQARERVDPAAAAMRDAASSLMSPPDDETPPRLDYQMDSRMPRREVVTTRVDPYDFVIDPDCTCLEDARWVGRRITALLERVKNEPLFKNVDGLRPSLSSDSPRRNRTSFAKAEIMRDPASFRERGMISQFPKSEYVTLYELFVRGEDQDGDDVWDLKVLPDSGDDFLQEESAVYDVGCPYSLARPHETGDSPFAISCIEPAYVHFVEEKEVRTRFYESVMRNLNGTLVVEKGSIAGGNASALTAVEVAKVGSILALESSTGRPARDLIAPAPYVSLMNETMAYLGIIEKNIENAVGLGPNQFLNALKSETSATESAEIAGWARARGRHIFETFEDFVVDVVRKQDGMEAQFYTGERIIRSAGRAAAAEWDQERFDPAMIRDGLRVYVERGSMQPVNDQTRQAAATQLIQLLTANPQLTPVVAQVVNVVPLIRVLAESIGSVLGSDVVNQDATGSGFADAALAMQMMTQLQGAQAGGGASPPGGSAPTGPTPAASPASAVQQGVA